MPWTIQHGGVGGSAIAASGVPESYALRTDHLLAVTLRVDESELADLLAELSAIRDSSDSFVFALDRDDEYTEREVYLHAPVWPDPVNPERDDRFLPLFRLPIVLRTADGLPWDALWSEGWP